MTAGDGANGDAADRVDVPVGGAVLQGVRDRQMRCGGVGWLCGSEAGPTPRLAGGEFPRRAKHVPPGCRQAASYARPQAGLPLTPPGAFPGAVQGAFDREPQASGCFHPSKANMKNLLAIAACATITACTTPKTQQEGGEAPPLRQPTKLVNYQHSGYVFCKSGCPDATVKLVLVALDISSPDAKERVLARLREQMLKQSSGAGAPKSEGPIAEIEKGGGSAGRPDAWTIYALHGDAESPGLQRALSAVVKGAVGGRFYVLASEPAEKQGAAYRDLLGRLGVPAQQRSAFVLKSPLKTDVALASPAAAASGSDAAQRQDAAASILLIRDAERN